MHFSKPFIAALIACASAPAASQLLPPVGETVGGVIRDTRDLGGDTLERLDRTVDETSRAARSLARRQLSRIAGVVREHRDVLEMSEDWPAVRGQVIAVDPSPEVLERIAAAGFRVIADEEIEGLGLRAVTLATPEGFSVDEAIEDLDDISPRGEFVANHIHFTSGGTPPPMAGVQAPARGSVGRPQLGMIDGGVDAHVSLQGAIEQRGFARGAPAASAHGTAIASLAVGQAAVRGAAPGVSLLVADIYGRDPAGGSATAIARALGWMAERQAPVVTMSVVGPSNRLVERAVERAQARGLQIVAPVGNDGPAAPHAYPASYRGVIAVTAVDRRNRVLAEAGRARHLDYAAPGADMSAASSAGGIGRVRGTSYAVPLVAGRLAMLGSRARLDAEAEDLGPRGPDDRYGRGLVCGSCRTPVR